MMTHFNKVLAVAIAATLIIQTNCFLSKNLKNIKEKAKQYYKSKFQKDKSWQFLGYDVTEYPGTNSKYREIHRQKWEEYYSCLHEQKQNLGPHGSATPEAVLGFEGGTVKFECKICLSPNERNNKEAIVWHWASLDSEALDPVEYTEHILLSPDDQSLQIYNLQVDNSGQYICELGEALTVPYFLTVINSSVNVSGVHSKSAPIGPYALEPQSIPQYNIVLDTEWGPWSACSKCDKIGRRHRLGYCTVMLTDAATREARFAANITSTTLKATLLEKQPSQLNYTTLTLCNTKPNATTTKSITTNGTVTDTDLELLRIFKYGVPCNSHILPESIKNLPSVNQRRNEIMNGYCREPCPEEMIFEVRDKDGNVIETANNSAGIYSMLQGLPPVEPPVERRLQYENWGEHIALSCPGNINSDAPIQWQIGSKNVVPELLAAESKGRIYVTVMDKINIQKSKVSDSNIYSCWQHKELAGTIRLVVEKRIQMNFNHHIMLLGILIILSTFLYIYVKAFFGRKYAKIKN